jgi:hypothetical protein
MMVISTGLLDDESLVVICECNTIIQLIMAASVSRDVSQDGGEYVSKDGRHKDISTMTLLRRQQDASVMQ